VGCWVGGQTRCKSLLHCNAFYMNTHHTKIAWYKMCDTHIKYIFCSLSRSSKCVKPDECVQNHATQHTSSLNKTITCFSNQEVRKVLLTKTTGSKSRDKVGWAALCQFHTSLSEGGLSSSLCVKLLGRQYSPSKGGEIEK